MQNHQSIDLSQYPEESYKVKGGKGENSEENDLKYLKVNVVDAQMIHYNANSDTHAIIYIIIQDDLEHLQYGKKRNMLIFMIVLV